MFQNEHLVLGVQLAASLLKFLGILRIDWGVWTELDTLWVSCLDTI